MTPVDAAFLVVAVVAVAIYLKSRKKTAPKKDIPKGEPRPGPGDDR